MSEKITGRCPYCGKEIDIPAELETFSCLYCGKRSRTELLRSQKDFKVEELQELASQLVQTLQEHDTLYKRITKKHYVPTFRNYETSHAPLLKKIDTMLFTAPMELEQAVDMVCRTFLDGMEEDLRGHKAYKTKRGQSNLLFEVKLVMALFLTPLTRKLSLRMAEPFCTILHDRWIERFPKEIWTPGDYDVIVKGFRRRRLCFITTAVCSHEGKADDCYELTALRAFRDGWFRENGGEDLIAEYYDIAPTLVTLMDYCDASDICYTEIRTRWLEPCLSALDNGEKELCRDTYVDMVQALRARYLQ